MAYLYMLHSVCHAGPAEYTIAIQYASLYVYSILYSVYIIHRYSIPPPLTDTVGSIDVNSSQ